MAGRAPRARGFGAGSHLRRDSPKVLGSMAPSLKIESLLLSAVGGLRPRTQGRGCTAAPDSGGRREGHPHLARGPRVGPGGRSALRLCASSHGLKSWKTKPRPEPAGTERGASCICSHSNSSGVFVEKDQKWRFGKSASGRPQPWGGAAPTWVEGQGFPHPTPPTSPLFLAPVSSRRQKAWRGTWRSCEFSSYKFWGMFADPQPRTCSLGSGLTLTCLAPWGTPRKPRTLWVRPLNALYLWGREPLVRTDPRPMLPKLPMDPGFTT